MDEKLQLLFIPYLFFSTAINQDAVIKAYSLSVQGFFIKQTKMEEIEKTILVIMEYWKRCAATTTFQKFNVSVVNAVSRLYLLKEMISAR
jgi:DNA-binding NarL/FixJ family response regulator